MDRLVEAILCMFRYVAREKQPESEVMTLRDRFLIQGRMDHPMKMKATESAEIWIDRFESEREILEDSARAARKLTLIPTDAEIQDTIHTAINPSLWTVIEKKVEDVISSGQDDFEFADLPPEFMLTWMVDAQETVDRRNRSRNSRKLVEVASVSSKEQHKEKIGTKTKIHEGHKSGDDKPKPKQKPTEEKTKRTVRFGDSESGAERGKRSEQEEKAMLEGRASMPCWHFENTGSCPRGEKCHFKHEAPASTTKKTSLRS